MKYLAAYALLVLGGKANPSIKWLYLAVIQAAEDVKNVLKEVGVDV
jgi:ribosomal protein L12E/L44/L45/RPP1/RPP2